MADISEQQRLAAEKAKYEAEYKATIAERRAVIRQLNDPKITEDQRNTLNAKYLELDNKATQLDEAAIKTQESLNRVTNQINQGPNPPVAGPGGEIPPYANQNTGGQSNNSTAARYQQAVADDQVRLNEANQGLANTNEQLAAVEREKAALNAQLRNAAPGSPEQAAILAKRNELNNKQAELETQQQALQDDVRVRENSLATNKNNLSLVQEGNPDRVSAPPPDPTMVTNDPSAPQLGGFDRATTTTAEPVPAGEDPYVDLQDEGENITQFDGTVEQVEPESVDSPYVDTEGTEEFDRADPDVFEPEGVDPEEDPYAQLVEDTEAEGGLVEFGEEGPVGVDRAELDARQANMQATLANARAQAALKAQRKQADDGDWRVKLRLAPGSNYLYRANDGGGGQAGILEPLLNTDGVVFPYTPQITTNYKANYNAYDLTHSNYRGYFYQGSSVDEINITATFTAQDTYEAQYLLAVIHFFRSVTKMFYGKDANAGTPPPLVFLQGLGEYQYNLHPCLVSQFTYSLPNDVDYIRARSPNQANLPAGLLNRRSRQTVAPTNPIEAVKQRLAGIGAKPGAVPSPPAPPSLGTKSPTYVPTKIDIQLSLLPVQSRSQVTNNFSLQKYANGDLLKGGFW